MTQPVRLRIQQTRYPHWGRYSGIGQYLRHLDSGRYRIDARLAADDDSEFPLRHKPAKDWLRNKVQRRGMPWYKLSDLNGELRILKASAAGAVDIVHFLDGEHGGQYLPQWLDWLPRRRPKLVISYHQPADMLPGLVRPEVASRFDRVVLVSPAQRGFFESFMPAERVVTIMHGIETEFFKPADEPGVDTKFRLISAGHWLRDWTVIRAVAERLSGEPDVEFHIVTGQPTGLEGLPNVRFHKGIDDEALLALYQQSSALFLPLIESTANNSVLEALACGLPIISTHLESVRCYAGEDAGLLLAPGDVEGAVTAIGRLRADRGLRQQLSRGARTRAEELSWPLIAQEYDRLYTELLIR